MRLCPQFHQRGLTFVEILVVLVVLAVLAFLLLVPATPRGTIGTQVLNNARALQLATMAMSLDSKTNGTGQLWVFDEKVGRVPSLEEYASNLVKGGYIREGDFRKLTGIPKDEPISSTNSMFRFYPVGESDGPDTIFICTTNWTPYRPLDSQPYKFGHGFVVMRKGGDGAIYQAKQATNSNVIGWLTTNAGGLPLQ